MRVTVFLMVLVLLVFGGTAATAQTTQPGLFFTISNGCDAPVKGFAVGDELCLLKIGSATYTRAIFQGTLTAGQEQMGMACTGDDGNGKVIFVPPAGTAVAAVVVTVKPDETVKIPSSFCGIGGEAKPTLEQLKKDM
jgi:hypothetical protein